MGYLGFHRLAIINTTTDGMQPFRCTAGEAAAADSGLLWALLICSGEIYNYKDLIPDDTRVLRSDVEAIDVLLRDIDFSVTKQVTEAVAKLDGDFAFAYVRVDGTYVVGRDPVGVRPLFYGVSSEGVPIAFASEAKALVGAPGIARIRVFPPGKVVIRTRPTRDTVPVELLPYTVDSERELAAAAKIVRETLTAAVAKRLLHSDRNVRMGLLCSGDWILPL